MQDLQALPTTSLIVAPAGGNEWPQGYPQDKNELVDGSFFEYYFPNSVSLADLGRAFIRIPLLIYMEIQLPI